MKKSIVYLALIVSCLGISGCALQSGYVNNNGFPSVMPGMIYNDQLKGNFMLPKLENTSGVTILGKVRGTSVSTNILMAFAFGDCSIEAAKKEALKDCPGADDIINVEVDARHESVLMIFNRITTVLRGYAIKYKK